MRTDCGRPFYTRVILVPEINPAEAQRKLIAEIPDQLTGGRLGLALFPDDTTEEEKVTTIHYREYVDFLDGHIARVLPVIVGCIEYRFAFSEQRGQTGFIYQLLMLNSEGQQVALELGPGGAIPPESLAIEPWISGFHAS